MLPLGIQLEIKIRSFHLQGDNVPFPCLLSGFAGLPKRAGRKELFELAL